MNQKDKITLEIWNKYKKTSDQFEILWKKYKKLEEENKRLKLKINKLEGN